MRQFSQLPKHEEFMALFVRHEPGIHSFLTSLLANLDDAEVVMQETSMAMWCHTLDKQAGLEVIEVELIPPN
jgi:DNA-directed RNA polymerase specialized sigma24 family protein